MVKWFDKTLDLFFKLMLKIGYTPSFDVNPSLIKKSTSPTTSSYPWYCIVSGADLEQLLNKGTIFICLNSK
ncbi:hypothetical protein [uncultured Nostoc sp.]|uniref:hypothetical protein n=1 Tax=uncultured Nostoc sp. TaxID=340711 RepID=UPI0035CCA245